MRRRRRRPIAPRLLWRGAIRAIGPYAGRRRASSPPLPIFPKCFGALVTIQRDDGREQTFRIVGEDEADPAQGSISHVAPLARAMFGKHVGDVVAAGAGEAEIVSIR